MYSRRFWPRCRADFPRWEKTSAREARTVTTIMMAPIPASDDPRKSIMTVTEVAAPSMGTRASMFMPPPPEGSCGGASNTIGDAGESGSVVRAGR
jgi:hypothetical protein